MKNIKLIVEYDGTNYSGWQKQNNNITVQGTLEEILSELTKEKIEIIGCSRTDSKVHARKYVCNFQTNSTIPSDKFKEALNVKLPCDIAILESSEVPLSFHARYDCIGKKYSYTILERSVKATIDRNFTYQCKYDLDIEKMQEATKHFIGTHDFSAFKNSGSSVKTSIRNITELKVEKLGNYIKIYTSADGFLYNMVRIIVGTLVDVGTNKIKPETIIDIINSKDRSEAGKTAPPQGLCLEEVYY
ncbi:tRNA pseudouridine(38-40) synthase [Clostridium argentinense CDC 2741]|uniref:tRNA pseudouridine synthase A n=1 Tax=Clostridium argentinense CDC 2741 TaxID=1418104 RepID=A0A0C1UKJ9_9CLOT|nr:tRNA pseudouridine(38-40) synthase TruA [Clostridium argentinense]ARC83710.1 tRNA pseudouridine synthase A [Clostridium argentinense]KIE47800.1 tRNA pseudouridine(38-40) synthase [Clostridium argentinense CDC 2741]NFF41080.1 tRNA pseudouridine(38-40) synthase TruA [Clostridium argentinense]NFP52002.1 tRNA pseudouridine(38-40) synthase TruA [Clostridium argentinense]NFP73752.1 tRNA pseudouridine(38-40) synthase TruA [Clostridium argentinense]